MSDITRIKMPNGEVYKLKDSEARDLIDILEIIKQDTLVSSVNIKTINGYNILGSGNINVSGGGGGEPEFFLKKAEIFGNTLTLYNKDETTVTYIPTIPEPIASNVNYDNSSSSLTSVNVQSALDEVSSSIDDINTLLGTMASVLDDINGEVI